MLRCVLLVPRDTNSFLKKTLLGGARDNLLFVAVSSKAEGRTDMRASQASAERLSILSDQKLPWLPWEGREKTSQRHWECFRISFRKLSTALPMGMFAEEKSVPQAGAPDVPRVPYPTLPRSNSYHHHHHPVHQPGEVPPSHPSLMCSA